MSSAGAPAEARLCTQPADTVRAVGHDTLPSLLGSPTPEPYLGWALLPRGGSLYSGGSRPQSLYSSRSAAAPARPGTATDVDGGGDASGLGETSPVRAAPRTTRLPAWRRPRLKSLQRRLPRGQQCRARVGGECATSGETTRSSVESSTADEGEEGEAEEEERSPKKSVACGARGKAGEGRTAGKLAVKKLGPLIKATGLPRI